MKCIKCGGTLISKSYNPTTDRLDHSCGGCGYNWAEAPNVTNEAMTKNNLEKIQKIIKD